MGTDIRIRVLGGFSIVDATGAARVLPTRKTRALLTFLALHQGQRFTRMHLSCLLWGHQPERQGRQSLRQALSALRTVLGESAIESDDEGIILASKGLVTDAHQFAALARESTLESAESACALYQGELLAGYDFGEHLFSDWLLAERARLRGLAREAFGNILVRRSNAAQLGEAITAANALISLDPFDETAHRMLMQLQVRQGRSNVALAHFRDFTAFLSREIGARPEDETIALYERLRDDSCSVPGCNTLSEYAFVLEQLVQCVVVTDRASRIVGWNKAAESQFGYTKDFMYGRTPTLMYAPVRDQSLADKLFKHAHENGHWSKRVKLLSKDGRSCYQTRTVQPLYNRLGQLIGGFGTGLGS